MENQLLEFLILDHTTNEIKQFINNHAQDIVDILRNTRKNQLATELLFYLSLTENLAILQQVINMMGGINKIPVTLWHQKLEPVTHYANKCIITHENIEQSTSFLYLANNNSYFNYLSATGLRLLKQYANNNKLNCPMTNTPINHYIELNKLAPEIRRHLYTINSYIRTSMQRNIVTDKPFLLGLKLGNSSQNTINGKQLIDIILKAKQSNTIYHSDYHSEHNTPQLQLYTNSPKIIKQLNINPYSALVNYTSYFNKRKQQMVRSIGNKLTNSPKPSITVLNQLLLNPSINTHTLFKKNLGSWQDSRTTQLIFDCYKTFIAIPDEDKNQFMLLVKIGNTKGIENFLTEIASSRTNSLVFDA